MLSLDCWEKAGLRIPRYSVLTSRFLHGTGRQEGNTKVGLNNGEKIKEGRGKMGKEDHLVRHP